MLFHKDKELLHKITNAILLLWLLAAIVSLLVSIIDTQIKEPSSKLTYEEYKNVYCYKNEDNTEEENELRCKGEYKINNADTYKTKVIYNSGIMIIVVGATLFLLNKKDKYVKIVK